MGGASKNRVMIACACLLTQQFCRQSIALVESFHESVPEFLLGRYGASVRAYGTGFVPVFVLERGAVLAALGQRMRRK
jgi:hypothetical protein